jgi:hypothetical protein
MYAQEIAEFGFMYSLVIAEEIAYSKCIQKDKSLTCQNILVND